MAVATPQGSAYGFRRPLSLLLPFLLLLTLLCAALCTTVVVAAPSPSTSPSSSPAPASAASPAPSPAEHDDASEQESDDEIDPAWFQVHGWLMWMSFGLLMPVGMITARHLQTVTPKWFAIHWGIQVLAVFLAVIAFFIGVARFDAITDSTHARMGIAVFTFTIAQPVMGFLRPHKGHTIRVYWYLAHWLFGMLAVGLGWYTLFLGLDIYEEETGTSVQGLEIALACNVSIMLFIFLLLGRWDHLVGQSDSASKVDGITRFPSVAHVTSLLHLAGHGGKASEERIAAERSLAEERAAALGP
eukprot:TRINITY_DN56217_c0_g1_i1.p1 TRINITY_DN56217_c0_g1~~TRINITY_DN56217_c0_g1_i1.p1  ORF type:complete len:301 (+),score=0.85 TRINITY_DN56217_c0_g1_i1:219-1121(+)